MTQLAEAIATFAGSFSGELGVAAKNLTTGEEFGFHAQTIFHPASTIKLPVLVEVYRQLVAGSLSLDDTLPLDPELAVPDGGVMDGFTPGYRYPVRDLAHLMITLSDNTATNLLIKRVGVRNVNDMLNAYGMNNTRLHRYIGIPGGNLPLGQTTPQDMIRLLELLVTEQILTPAACQAILNTMSHQLYHHLTTRYLDEWDEELPPERVRVRIAAKSGWNRRDRHDVAALWAPRATYVLAMYSRRCADDSFKLDNEAALLLPKVSLAVYDAWGRA
ncbi:MAG TPA: serine hydrolase [Symbiobacteriaceae bacterium]|jgi:beta-lactamase class A